MEYHPELKRHSKDEKSYGTSAKTAFPLAGQTVDLQDGFKQEKPNLSCSDLHHEITRNTNDVSPKNSANHQKQRIGRKGKKEDELVKYMSKVPNYLEKGKTLQEKVLNVGVLDWGRLEKWQCSHKHMPYCGGRSSLSSSNLSSSFSEDASASQSGRGYISSPSHQRIRRSSLQFHLTSSPVDAFPQSIKSVGQNVQKFQDLRDGQSNTFNNDGKFIRTEKPFGKAHPETKLEEFKGIDSDSMICLASGALPNRVKYEVGSTTKVKLKTQDGQCAKRAEKRQEENPVVADQFVPGKQETVVLHLPSDIPQSNVSRTPNLPDLTMTSGQRQAETRRRSFSEKSKDTEPCEVDNNKLLQMKQTCLIDAKIDSSSKRSQSVPRSAKIENAVASSGLDTSSSDKGNASSQARSSPLRRLLDQILKSRPTNGRSNSDPLPKDSISKDKTSNPSDGGPCSLNVAAQSGKVKLNLTSCTTINVNDSLQEKKHGSEAAQALLRVAVKNGQPLFTFAVDNESDILAATLKKISTSRKEDYSCLYTFFTIQEVKKKNGRWLNHRGKGQIHDYIPTVVAQMKARGSCSSNLIKENHVDHFSMREFVLSSVELRSADWQTSDLQPNNELAAIIVKIPMRISRSSDMQEDHPEEGLKDNLPEVTSDSNCGTKIQNCPSIISQDIGATVILPSGVHAVPHKGEPSSLIQRWRSGGSCDCGGWDLGCKLRILANWNQLIGKAGSSNACSTPNHFALFYQGGLEDNGPLFSLAPFKDGIYAVEFNPSLSLLQAFSICIAVLDSRKACEFSESSNLFEEKASTETVLVPNDGKRAPDQTEGEVPARYVSYPPLSPVGRV
ncbi:hypothetical protein CUMW_032960 [Citrus unshiu]|nr:hypothetical protein CUMW_032960 [Citrus unshiu]